LPADQSIWRLQTVTAKQWAESVTVAHCHVNDGVPASTMKNKGNQRSHTEVLAKYKLLFLKDDAWEAALRHKHVREGKPFWDALAELS
jgi:hypothetical protein